MLFFYAQICPTVWNCGWSFPDFFSQRYCLFLLFGLRKLCRLLVVILDGVIVPKHIWLNSWCALATTFFNAYACSKFVGLVDNKPLNSSWVDEITNFISSFSSRALSSLTMLVSLWQLILGEKYFLFFSVVHSPEG